MDRAIPSAPMSSCVSPPPGKGRKPDFSVHTANPGVMGVSSIKLYLPPMNSIASKGSQLRVLTLVQAKEKGREGVVMSSDYF